MGFKSQFFFKITHEGDSEVRFHTSIGQASVEKVHHFLFLRRRFSLMSLSPMGPGWLPLLCTPHPTVFSDREK